MATKKITDTKKTEKFLDAAAFLDSPADLTPVRLDLPELGGHIYMRSMTGDEGVRYSTIGSDPANKSKPGLPRATMISFCACNEAGDRLFTASQVEQLGKKSVKVLNKMHLVAMRLCGFAPDEEAKDDTPKDALAKEKNDSSEAATDASPTA